MVTTPTASTASMEEEKDDKPDAYFWAEDTDEIRRAFIIDVMSDADIDGGVLVDNMNTVFQWLKSGELPKKSKVKPHALHRSDGEIQERPATQRQQERPEGKES